MWSFLVRSQLSFKHQSTLTNAFGVLRSDTQDIYNRCGKERRNLLKYNSTDQTTFPPACVFGWRYSCAIFHSKLLVLHSKLSDDDFQKYTCESDENDILLLWRVLQQVQEYNATPDHSVNSVYHVNRYIRNWKVQWVECSGWKFRPAHFWKPWRHAVRSRCWDHTECATWIVAETTLWRYYIMRCCCLQRCIQFYCVLFFDTYPITFDNKNC